MTVETISYVYVTYIASTPDKVFEAITRPELARRYWPRECLGLEARFEVGTCPR